MIKSLLFLTLITSFLIACSPASRDKFTKPEQGIGLSAFAEGKVITHEPNRNVEIIVMVDPSSSMAPIIKKVDANFDQLAAVFIEDKISNVHFRLSVVTPWDTDHFNRLEKQKNNKKIFRQNFWPNLDFNLVKGKLRPVVVNGVADESRPPFIAWNMTKNLDEMYEILRETLKVKAEIHKYELLPGTNDKIRNVFELAEYTSIDSLQDETKREFVTYFIDENKNDDQDSGEKDQALYGPSPNNEEFFSVLRHMLTDETRAMNAGFPSPEANQLAIFIVTDAEDDSRNKTNISAQQIHKELVQFMGNDKSKVVVYGALFESDRKQDCKVRALDKNGEFMLEPEFLFKPEYSNGDYDLNGIKTTNPKFNTSPQSQTEYIGGHPGVDGVKNPNFNKQVDTYKFVNKYRDPGYKGKRSPRKIEQLIKLSGGEVKSICSDKFGADLAEVGLSIKKRTLEQKRVVIDTRKAYDKESIQVLYGDDPVDFIFSSEYDTEIIVPADAYQFVPGKKFKLKFESLTRKNQFNN